MTKTLVRYKLKTGNVAENEILVSAVYAALHEKDPEGFHYCTFKLADGLSFIHIAFADNKEASAAFASLPAFKNFQAGIKERCDEQPVVNQVTVIGSYNFQEISV